MFQWDVNLYNKFGKERLKPSIELTNKLDNDYTKIIDIGCGSGLSTSVLRSKFTKASILGVDLSLEMLEKAKGLNLDVDWLQRDCSKALTDLGKFDLVFSNAFLQWIPNQEEFLKNAKEILSDDGVIAVQVPNWQEMPIKLCVDKVASKFDEFNQAIESNCYGYNMGKYYDMLTPYYNDIDIWQTNYAHVMNSYDEIINFISGTGIRPYLDKLDNVRKNLFIKYLKEELPSVYPKQQDDKILFIFERIMFIAR